jgi:hypothetical protein
MAKGGARPGAGRPKKSAIPKAATPRGGARAGAGRPMSKQFVPTADHRGNVEAMTGFGIPEAEICRLIRNPETGKPIDKKTLELHFADEIATGQTKANATVGRFIYATITKGPGGSNYEPGRIDLAKFWAARRMGWKETSVHQHEGKLDNGSSAREIVTGLITRLSDARTAGSDNSSDDESGAGGTPV